MSQLVLAMYDVRGIQKYIFRTAKVQDATGASAIVEDILLEALKYAVNSMEPSLSMDAKWHQGKEALEFEKGKAEVQVLFVGGGNAYVIFRDRELCLEINRRMSAYVMKQTYSLQLAAAVVDCTDDYQEDYRKLHEQMNRTKADMIVSKPLGALPVMQIEVKTGYPLGKHGSTETWLKKKKNAKRLTGEQAERIFDNYVTEKGVDSTIAVVHIDGNNMGLRIREQIQGIQDYKEAVRRMRKISCNINESFQQVFQETADHFNRNAVKGKRYFVRKILVAGDDITYVCNGQIALATIEYFCRKVSGLTMTGDTDEESIQKYGFSVCAGAAFINSHFPFHVGYEVAEECCESAKKRAKEERYMDHGRIGSFVDFHICKNVHAQNLKLMRQREYRLEGRYSLLTRPYYISTEQEGGLGKLNEEAFAFDRFKEAVRYFRNEKNMPRSFAKDLRNTYAQGADQMKLLINFLESRKWKLPDGEHSAFREDGTAKWYDALEMLDYCMDPDETENSVGEEG